MNRILEKNVNWDCEKYGLAPRRKTLKCSTLTCVHYYNIVRYFKTWEFVLSFPSPSQTIRLFVGCWRLVFFPVTDLKYLPWNPLNYLPPHTVRSTGRVQIEFGWNAMTNTCLAALEVYDIQTYQRSKSTIITTETLKKLYNNLNVMYLC